MKYVCDSMLVSMHIEINKAEQNIMSTYVSPHSNTPHSYNTRSSESVILHFPHNLSNTEFSIIGQRTQCANKGQRSKDTVYQQGSKGGCSRIVKGCYSTTRPVYIHVYTSQDPLYWVVNTCYPDFIRSEPTHRVESG